VLEKVLGAVRQSGFQEAAKKMLPLARFLISAGCSLVCQLLPREKKQKSTKQINKNTSGEISFHSQFFPNNV